MTSCTTNSLQSQVTGFIFEDFFVVILFRVDVFNALGSKVPIGVVPQENSIFGNVIETYNFLKVPDAAFIRGEITLKVEHSLLTRKGVQLQNIRRVLSHEQVCLLRL